MPKCLFPFRVSATHGERVLEQQFQQFGLGLGRGVPVGRGRPRLAARLPRGRQGALRRAARRRGEALRREQGQGQECITKAQLSYLLKWGRVITVHGLALRTVASH